MIRSIRLLCLLLIGSVLRLSAQVSPLAKPEVVPPAPTAASLGKYGNIPVSLYTGVPEISVPLYTIQAGDLTLPISLSYHAAGFRVSDSAPWSGLGWSLQAGGNISRSAIGGADDLGFLNNTSLQTASQLDGSDVTYVLAVSGGAIDNESDLYFYSFNGRSGKFVYNMSKQPVLVPQEPLKITTGPNYYIITAEDGTVYEFKATESMTAGYNTAYGPEDQTYTSTYHLSKIISADGADVINLYYSGTVPYTEYTYSFTEVVGSRCSASGPVSNQHDYYPASQSYRVINEAYLDSITFANGNVVFTRVADRTDFGPPVRLATITVNKKKPLGNGYTREKSFTLQTGYYTGGALNANRLKLNSVTELDATITPVRKHEFYYNETAKLPARGSYGQDWWGFANGKNTMPTTTSLIQEEVVSPDGYAYTVGSADRSPDATAMQACILKKIVYPTGGFTEFDYESNYFDGATPVSHSISATAGVMGNTTDLLQQTVQITPTDNGWAKVSTHCSNVTDGVPYFSNVNLRKVGGTQSLVDHIYDPYTEPPFEPEWTEEFLVYLEAGATYELTVKSKGHSQSTLYGGAAFSEATVYWKETTPGQPQLAGGLRVKEIRDYERNGATPVTRIYKYGQNENQKGILLTPATNLTSFKEFKTERYWKRLTENFCNIVCQTGRLYVHADTPQELTTLSGSSVVYSEVAVYENNAATAPNGKTVYHFDVERNEVYPATGYRDGLILLDNGWQGGDMVSSTDYAGTTTNVRKTENVYKIHQPTNVTATKMGYRFSEVGECAAEYSSDNLTTSFYWFDYPIRTGVKKLVSEKETRYASTDPSKSIYTQTTYAYDNLSADHQQLSSRVTLDSEGNTITTRYWYPADYTDTDVTPLVTNKHILSTPLREEAYRNNQIISGKFTVLNADGNPTEIHQYEASTLQSPPVHDPANFAPPAGYIKKADIVYDGTTKNIQKVQLTDNTPSGYIWAYRNTYPVAKIENADASGAAATSFESDGKGNWTYAGSPSGTTVVPKTGVYSYKLSNGNVTRSLSAGKYKLEYWSQVGTPSVTGGTITSIRTSAADANGWILYESEVNVSSTTTLTISSATAWIDELRLYPVTAQITTYTFDAAKGITSVNDPANVIVYYEYDSFGRLKWAKDMNGNIVKAQAYHYKGN